jgi:RNA ligase (TIGR02306 family)
MIEHPDTLGLPPNIKVGTDVAKKLGITKYIPPQKSKPGMMRARPKRHRNPDFKMYTNIGHLKYYPEAFNNIYIWVTEKIHGTNFRAGYVKYNAYNWWRKIAKCLGFPGFQWDFAYGSHRVELTRKGKRAKQFYDQNVYWLMAEKYKLREILLPGQVIYAEIYGYGIQKGYAYGCKENEFKMVVVDVMIDGRYIDGVAAALFCKFKELPYAPILAEHMLFDMDKVSALVNPPGDKSVLCPEMERPIEGIVIKPVIETVAYMGRAVFKLINDKYWLNKGNTDWH